MCLSERSDWGENGWGMSRDDVLGVLTSRVGLIGLGVSQVVPGVRRQSGYVG